MDPLCDINDAEGYWLSTTIPAIQVRTVELDGGGVGIGVECIFQSSLG